MPKRNACRCSLRIFVGSSLRRTRAYIPTAIEALATLRCISLWISRAIRAFARARTKAKVHKAWRERVCRDTRGACSSAGEEGRHKLILATPGTARGHPGHRRKWYESYVDARRGGPGGKNYNGELRHEAFGARRASVVFNARRRGQPPESRLDFHRRAAAQEPRYIGRVSSLVIHPAPLDWVCARAWAPGLLRDDDGEY